MKFFSLFLKKLHNSDVLYSLIRVNKRFDTIVNDSMFTRNLILITPFNGLSFQFTDTIFDRFCLEILPKINDKIERLNVESSSMKRIFHATNYPNLHTLGLYDLTQETISDLFSGKIFSSTLSMINCIRIIYLKIYFIQSEFDYSRGYFYCKIVFVININ
jgi:hypothetical protein